MIFPNNFDLLHLGEETIRAESKKAIKISDDLLHHFNMVAQSMTLIDHFAREYTYQTNDQLIVQYLGLRLFNGMAGSVQNLMAGYYQNAVMVMRDLLEVTFLLDYFYADMSLISNWTKCSEDERSKKFSAFKVRCALDERDGFTEMKRKKYYQLLCNLGTHASIQGFELLRPLEGGEATCGPYFADRACNATVSELAKISQDAAGVFTLFFEPRGVLDSRIKQNFMGARSAWFKKFFEQSPDVA